ncbi:glycosyltransferase [Patulibacter sp. SYSU D01012]|uniref:glycosyltransferase n=1 Tax=Patulibacter sp. SYSU D01012 TaxID=2817381 RepID=UPI001B304291
MSPAARPRVLVVSQDRLDGQVAGTSIRALELARVLSRTADVVLAGVGTPPDEVDRIPCVGYDPQHPDGLRAVLGRVDVAVALPGWPPLMRLLRASGVRIVFDLYVPQPLEIIGGFAGLRPRVGHALTEFATDRIVEALRTGDLLLCATEGQRDLYLGMLLAERLIDGDRYRHDPTLRSVIDVVPFGLPAGDAARTGAAGPRDVFPGIGPDDEVVLWNGGVWPWLDPVTAVRAVAELATTRPTVRLVFMGAATQVPAQRTAELARRAAAELEVLDRHVVFHDGWVPYDERADWLLQADAALYAHHDHLETRFAFRTRLLDCFWSRLPVVCTTGDDLATHVEEQGAGAVFAPGDVAGCAAALARVLDAGRDAYAGPLGRLADRYRWDAVAEPLVDYVARDDAPAAPRRTLRPGHAARHHGYRVARRALDAVGLRDWPRL